MEIRDVKRLPNSVVEQFKQYATPTISDALNRVGISGGCLGIRPAVPGLKMVGSAYTVRRLPSDQVSPSKGGDYLDHVRPGDVVVIDNGGRINGTVWGDILTMAAKQIGLSGTLIDGACRDVSTLKELEYPVFSLGIHVQTGKDRSQMEAFGVPVSVRDVRVDPGDVIIGDDSGVVVVPHEVAEEVLAHCAEIEEAENLIRASVDKGLDREDAHLTLAEARQKYGYWDLQKKR